MMLKKLKVKILVKLVHMVIGWTSTSLFWTSNIKKEKKKKKKSPFYQFISKLRWIKNKLKW